MAILNIRKILPLSLPLHIGSIQLSWCANGDCLWVTNRLLRETEDEWVAFVTDDQTHVYRELLMLDSFTRCLERFSVYILYTKFSIYTNTYIHIQRQREHLVKQNVINLRKLKIWFRKLFLLFTEKKHSVGREKWGGKTQSVMMSDLSNDE